MSSVAYLEVGLEDLSTNNFGERCKTWTLKSAMALLGWNPMQKVLPQATLIQALNQIKASCVNNKIEVTNPIQFYGAATVGLVFGFNWGPDNSNLDALLAYGYNMAYLTLLDDPMDDYVRDGKDYTKFYDDFHDTCIALNNCFLGNEYTFSPKNSFPMKEEILHCAEMMVIHIKRNIQTFPKHGEQFCDLFNKYASAVLCLHKMYTTQNSNGILFKESSRENARFFRKISSGSQYGSVSANLELLFQLPKDIYNQVEYLRGMDILMGLLCTFNDGISLRKELHIDNNGDMDSNKPADSILLSEAIACGNIATAYTKIAEQYNSEVEDMVNLFQQLIDNYEGNKDVKNFVYAMVRCLDAGFVAYSCLPFRYDGRSVKIHHMQDGKILKTEEIDLTSLDVNGVLSEFLMFDLNNNTSTIEQSA